MEENADLMMVIAVVHLVGLAPNAPKFARKDIMVITVWNHVTVRTISIYVILLMVVFADMDTQVQIVMKNCFRVTFRRKMKPAMAV